MKGKVPMKKLGKYGKKVSCVVIGMLCAAAIGACGSTQSGSQDEKDVRNDISVYEEELIWKERLHMEPYLLSRRPSI